MNDEANNRYILLECINADGEIASSVELAATRWRVSEAEPVPGSQTDRTRHDVTTHDREAVEEAVKEFFDRMKDMQLPGVIDTGNLRAWHDNALDFTCRLTEEINDDLPDVDAENFRDDDFDNHPLAPLREAMVDNCPEFSGEVPKTGDAGPDL